MKPYLSKSLFVSLFLIIGCSEPSLATKATDPGLLMYEAGYLEQAKQYYQAKIAADPKPNADDHYMLGNILVQLKRPRAARNEYRTSADLDPFGSTGKYSQQALEQLRIKFENRRFRPADYHNDDQQRIKSSVRAISSQISEEESKAKIEHDALVKLITTTAEASIQQIEDEMGERLSAYARYRYASSPNSPNTIIVQDCRARIASIRSRTSLEIAKAQTAYQEKIQALEDSAQSIEKLYISGRQSSNVFLNPAGSNIYLRNYQVDGTPSGIPVPIMAAPAKALAPPQLDKKDSHQGYAMWVSFLANPTQTYY